MTPEQLALYKVFDCIFMKPHTKLSSSFIMSSSGSHSYRFLTVDKSTVRGATNSYLQFSHTPKQAGQALQAADVSCDWILWLTELSLVSTEPRTLTEMSWIYSCSIFGLPIMKKKNNHTTHV